MAKKSYVVIGLGRFGLSLCEQLLKLKVDVIGVDSKPEVCDSALKVIPNVILADATREKDLKINGIHNADTVIISFGEDFEATLLTYIALKELNCKHVIVRSDKESYTTILKKIVDSNVDRIISPTEIASSRLAVSLVSPAFSDFFSLSDDYCVVLVNVPESYPAIKIKDLDARNNYGVNLLSIIRNEQSFIPKANDELRPGDKIHVFGEMKQVKKFNDSINKKIKK